MRYGIIPHKLNISWAQPKEYLLLFIIVHMLFWQK